MSMNGKYVFEVIKGTFSLAFIESVVVSYGYFIHEQVTWRKRIHAKKNIRVHSTSSIRNAQNIYIGENSHINIHCSVWPGEDSKIILGDNLLMGPGCSLQAANHGIFLDEGPMMFQERTQKDIVIGNDVWLGSNVTVTAGARIADGCICAAGCVVTKQFDEPNCIIAGIPARVIGKRKYRK